MASRGALRNLITDMPRVARRARRRPRPGSVDRPHAPAVGPDRHVRDRPRVRDWARGRTPHTRARGRDPTSGEHRHVRRPRRPSGSASRTRSKSSPASTPSTRNARCGRRDLAPESSRVVDEQHSWSRAGAAAPMTAKEQLRTGRWLAAPHRALQASCPLARDDVRAHEPANLGFRIARARESPVTALAHAPNSTSAVGVSWSRASTVPGLRCCSLGSARIVVPLELSVVGRPQRDGFPGSTVVLSPPNNGCRGASLAATPAGVLSVCASLVECPVLASESGGRRIVRVVLGGDRRPIAADAELAEKG